MKLTAFFYLVALWGISNVRAEAPALKAPPFEWKGIMQGKELQIETTPPVGHHFNVQAPASLKVGKGAPGKPQASATPQKVIFRVPVPNEPLEVSLYLCDDKNTFCEKHVRQGQWNAMQAKLVSANEGAALKASATTANPTGLAPVVPAAGASVQTGSTVTHLASGKTGTGLENSSRAAVEKLFLMNTPEEALALAQKTGKPLLVDFFGIWCPPCNELDSKVFPTSTFSKASEGFVRLKLDVDAAVSWAWKAKYKIGGYPTLLFLTPEGEEIGRVVGYLPADLLATRLAEAASRKNIGLNQIVARADAGSAEAARRAGEIYLQRGDAENALKYLKDPAQGGESFYLARIQWTESKDPAQHRHALEAHVQAYPRSPESLGSRMALADVKDAKPAATRSWLHQVVSTAMDLSRHPERLKGTDYAPEDVIAIAAEAHEKLEDKVAAKRAWAEVAKLYRAKARTLEDRGAQLELAYALSKSDRLPEALKLYGELEAAYPTEFTFYYAHASALMRDKKATEARGPAEKALEFSYGDNRLRSALLLAKVNRELGLLAESRGVVEAALQTVTAPEGVEVRTHKYVQMLKDLQKEIDTAQLSPSAPVPAATPTAR